MSCNPEWDLDPNPFLATTLGAAITILASYVPYQSLKEAGLETEMAHCHLSINLTNWTIIDEVRDSTKDIREDVAEMMKLESFDTTSQACSVVALSVLILIGKNVTEQNRSGWFRNRWKALTNVMS